jgi:PTS system arbutin-like IIC component
MLTGMGKVFGCTGIALALYSTAKPEKKKMVLGLVLGAAITAILTGITEPIEFTFLFIAPALFVLHALLSATMATLAFMLGVSGNFQTGLIDFVFQNWLPLGANHMGTYVIQIALGLTFTAIYFFSFRAIILKYNLMTPGRDDAEVKFVSKAEYRASQKGNTVNGSEDGQANAFIEGLGGRDNIELLTNCATRLRVKVKNAELVQPTSYFQQQGAVNVVRNGESFQIIVGLTVPQVREEMSQLIQA